jgi:hypothetical protein
MSNYRTQEIVPEKLLVMAANLLHKAFYDSTRLLAKRRYQLLEEGQVVFLVKVDMEDGSQLDVNIKLDRSELRGKLNFSAFRQLIGQLLAGFATKLQEKQPLNIFSDTEQRRWLYLIPALLQTPERINVMILGADARQAGALTLELMFVDPDQFKQQSASN